MMDPNLEEKDMDIWEEHPLTNFVVLKQVFSFDTCQSTIMRNRLVSKSWLEACHGHWLKMKTYPVLRYIFREDGVGGYQPLKGRSVLPLTLPEFHSFYQAKHPLVIKMVASSPREIALYDWEFPQIAETTVPDKTSPVDLTIDRWFWTWTATERLHRLTLVDCEFREKVWVFKEAFLKTLPSLEELIVRDCVVHQDAISDINEDHQAWMDHEGRAAWLNTRRRRRTQVGDANLVYAEGGYAHKQLHTLDVALRVTGGGEDGKAADSPRIWGPLLAMLPNLKSLRVAGYCENTEDPPPLLKPPCWNEATNAEWEQLKTRSDDLGFDSKGTELLDRFRHTWLGFQDKTFPEDPAPPHLGNFWELFWDDIIGQVEVSLECLNLLDFSGGAQQYGVLSTCEIAAENKSVFGYAYVYNFKNLKQIAFDMGMDRVFADRDIYVLNLWAPKCKRITLYRAPFEKTFPHASFLRSDNVKEVEFWGNVSPDLTFLYRLIRVRKLVWTTSCFDSKYKGKRLYNFIKQGKKAYPLFNEDLVKKTDWSRFKWLDGEFRYSFLRHLEMDWIMSVESWKLLASFAKGVTWLKGLVQNDEQLEEITKLWPSLISLKFAHGSGVSAHGLVDSLPKFTSLRDFTWDECACTRRLFEGERNALRKIEMQVKSQLRAKIIFPWRLAEDDTFIDRDTICIQKEFENCLLTGNSTRFLDIIKK